MIGEAPVDGTHKVLFTASYKTDDNDYGIVSPNMVIDATNSGCPVMTGTSAFATLFYNDGSTSIALALKDPSGTNTDIVEAGAKNFPDPDYYFVNTFLILDSTKPR